MKNLCKSKANDTPQKSSIDTKNDGLEDVSSNMAILGIHVRFRGCKSKKKPRHPQQQEDVLDHSRFEYIFLLL